MKSLLLLLPLAFLGCAVSQGPLKLELASVLFRHGDRSPVASNSFPTNNYTEADWPQGYGQLSIVGMQQHHKLGTLLRDRYIVNGTCNGLVCSNYTRVQVNVRSTDVDRTLMSVEAQLSAFFPPGPNQTFREGLPWQPIPVHTVPKTSDSLLRAVDSCPAFNDLLNADKQSPGYIAVEEKYKDLLDDLSKFCGAPVNLSNAWGIYDTLYIQNITEGYHSPSWATEERMAMLSQLADNTLVRRYNSTEKHRLTAGLWMDKVLTDMKNKVNTSDNKTLEDMKLFLYSAHDTTVAAMTSALGVFNNHQPGYATAFLVELYSDADKNFYVKMFRRDGPDSDTFEPLTSKYFCTQSGSCTLEEFEDYVKPLVPTDLVSECHGGKGDTPDKLTISVIGLGSVLSIVLIITIILTVILITVCRKYRAKNDIYSALHSEA